MPQLTPSDISSFQETVWEYYRCHSRSMPWRDDPSAYKVVVSELMLQQTQVARVIPKFDAFMYTCSSFASLAEKSLAEVLLLWSGLGYNRRAKFLHQTAQLIVSEYGGVLPNTFSDLMKLPGIGKNTAGAILAYVHNQPVIFVETNIRTVYFHHFFIDSEIRVSDTELEVLVEATLVRENPREWYWALMDYGNYLKKLAGGRLETSTHYMKQSPFAGSPREMRGAILKVLTNGRRTRHELFHEMLGDVRFEPALTSLIHEGFVIDWDGELSLTGDRETS